MLEMLPGLPDQVVGVKAIGEVEAAHNWITARPRHLDP